MSSAEPLPRWGIVTTIKAPARTTLEFVAYHLELGADRITVFLDAPCPVSRKALRFHPKARVFVCDDAFWEERGGRPDKHQQRQTKNATMTYRRQRDLDWLLHIDVDEFLVPDRPVAQVLADLSPEVRTFRVRPMERLGGGDGRAYKGFIPSSDARAGIVSAIYPTFGTYMRSGFLSHTAGKIFVRSGIKNLKFRIHNAIKGGNRNPGHAEAEDIALAHVHALDFESWKENFKFRLQHGSYRSELKATGRSLAGAMTLHDLFSAILASEGDAGIKKFYDEVVGDSPDLRARLDTQGLLRTTDLRLDAALKAQFPDVDLSTV